jgi:dihydrofolate reductase
MGTIIAVEYVSLDGVMEDPAWSMPYFNEELQRFQYDNLFAADALLLGRVTYDGFRAAWPPMSDEKGFADRMNGMPKYVATRGAGRPEWNATFLAGGLAEAVAGLKASGPTASAPTLLVNGSGDLVNQLAAAGLIDEYRLMVYPVVAGAGKRLFDERAAGVKLALAGSWTTASGVAVLTYRPAR